MMFQTAAEYLPYFLREIDRDGVLCRNVNFPLGKPNGQRVCGVSMYSRFRPHLVAHNRREHEDVAQLENGYITLSVLRPSALADLSLTHPRDVVERGDSQLHGSQLALGGISLSDPISENR